MALEWMAWTLPTGIFFVTIALILVGMTIWQIRSPSPDRRGVLPLSTTRGDRLFIGLLGSAYIQLLWIGLTSASLWISLGLAIVWAVLVMRYG